MFLQRSLNSLRKTLFALVSPLSISLSMLASDAMMQPKISDLFHFSEANDDTERMVFRPSLRLVENTCVRLTNK